MVDHVRTFLDLTGKWNIPKHLHLESANEKQQVVKSQYPNVSSLFDRQAGSRISSSATGATFLITCNKQELQYILEAWHHHR